MARRTLSPHGTARELFEERSHGGTKTDEVAELFRSLRPAVAVHDVAPEELYLAEELVRITPWLSPPQTRALCFAVVATIISTKQGSTRLPLGGGPGGALGRLLRELCDAASLDFAVSPLLREIRALAVENYFGRLIGGAGEFRPLICADDCIYLQRHFDGERELVTRARARIDGEELRVAGASEAAANARTSGPFPLSDEQAAAVELAISRSLAVISGGPGTGKTAIAAAILRATEELGVSPERMLLAAPTGKAAQRLSESIAKGLDEKFLSRLPAPRTLHRLLGYRPGGGFRHHENHVLSADIVLVDEASMIDLALMERLLAALSPDTRLVLLGDSEQLPSVDAGAVLRDFVLAGDRVLDRKPYSIKLSQSFRMDPTDPDGRAIYELSLGISSGDAKAITRAPRSSLADLDYRGVRALDQSSQAALQDFAESWLRAHFLDRPGFADRSSRLYRQHDGNLEEQEASLVRELLHDIERAKILTATRRHSAGSEQLAELLHRAFRQHVGGSVEDLGPGEPILVTKNDYRRDLFNGDTGVMIRVIDEDGHEHLRAAFARSGGIRLFPIQALRGVVTLGHAITVHRAQGSEYEHVAIVFPDHPLPMLTRELLYTGVTRARRSVTLFGPRDLYRSATRRQVQRYSGVASRLCAES